MNDSTTLTKAELATVATPARVRVLQIIYSALGAGVVTLAVILLGITSDGKGFSGMILLSTIHVFIAMSAFFMGMILFEFQVRRLGQLASVDQMIPTITAAYVIRAALFEGPAIFGIIVVFLAGKQQLAAQPVIWANLATAVIFLLMLAMTFPTVHRIRKLLSRSAHARP